MDEGGKTEECYVTDPKVREDFRKERIATIVGCCCSPSETWAMPHSKHALLIACQQLANSCVLSMAVSLPSASSWTSVPSHQSEGQSGILCPGVMYAIQLRVECTDVLPPTRQPAPVWAHLSPVLTAHFQVSVSPTPPLFHCYLIEVTDSVFITVNFQHVALCPRHSRYAIKSV